MRRSVVTAALPSFIQLLFKQVKWQQSEIVWANLFAINFWCMMIFCQLRLAIRIRSWISQEVLKSCDLNVSLILALVFFFPSWFGLKPPESNYSSLAGSESRFLLRPFFIRRTAGDEAAAEFPNTDRIGLINLALPRTTDINHQGPFSLRIQFGTLWLISRLLISRRTTNT